jgi:hypothetical protein
MHRVFWAALGLALSAAACDFDYTRCDEPPPEQLAALPNLLSETGLYSDVASESLAPGVATFEPLAALWSDGAEKQRFIALPDGSAIDTRNMDDWQFPVGTKLWKTFVRDGVRVETRYMYKRSDDWAAAAYVYDADGVEAQLTAAGAQDVLGTGHDVPAAALCPACHRGRSSFVLGFSAIQLAHDDPSPAALTLARLSERAQLTAVPRREPRIPGDETTRAALAYVHANCGHCHNSARPSSDGARCFDPENDLDFWLRVDTLGAPAHTPTLRSASAHASQMVRRMSRRGAGQMPPLASELVDERGLALVRRWIDGL